MTTEESHSLFATPESKELRRLRASMSFRVGILLSEAIRSPIKLLLLPFRLFRELFFSKSSGFIDIDVDPTSVLIVGIDTRGGSKWADRAIKLAIELQRFNSSTKLFILATGDSRLQERAGRLLIYRIPRPRSFDSGRRDWNMTCERLLSTMIHTHTVGRVVFLGDYLFSGVCRALNSAPAKSKVICLHETEVPIGLEKVSRGITTQMYIGESGIQNTETIMPDVTIQDHLNLRLDRTFIIHIHLPESAEEEWGASLSDAFLEAGLDESYVTVSSAGGKLNNCRTLPYGVDPFSCPGVHFRIISDDPELLQLVQYDKVPSIILRTDRELNLSSMKLLEQRELTGDSIVLRNNFSLDLSEAIMHLSNPMIRTAMVSQRLRLSDDVPMEVKWAATMHSIILGD